MVGQEIDDPLEGGEVALYPTPTHYRLHSDPLPIHHHPFTLPHHHLQRRRHHHLLEATHLPRAGAAVPPPRTNKIYVITTTSNK